MKNFDEVVVDVSYLGHIVSKLILDKASSESDKIRIYHSNYKHPTVEVIDSGHNNNDYTYDEQAKHSNAYSYTRFQHDSVGYDEKYHVEHKQPGNEDNDKLLQMEPPFV
jgi:hypothetical protein